MTTRIATTLIILALVVPLFAAEPYQLVVNSKNPTSSLSKATTRNYFMGVSTRWPNGTAVKPIDLPESSPLRAQFSKNVLGKSVTAVKSHWLTLVFAGRGIPPLQLGSEEEILAAVRGSEAAIAYVSSTIPLGPGVKAVPLTD